MKNFFHLSLSCLSADVHHSSLYRMKRFEAALFVRNIRVRKKTITTWPRASISLSSPLLIFIYVPRILLFSLFSRCSTFLDLYFFFTDSLPPVVDCRRCDIIPPTYTILIGGQPVKWRHVKTQLLVIQNIQTSIIVKSRHKQRRKRPKKGAEKMLVGSPTAFSLRAFNWEEHRAILAVEKTEYFGKEKKTGETHRIQEKIKKEKEEKNI